MVGSGAAGSVGGRGVECVCVCVEGGGGGGGVGGWLGRGEYDGEEDNTT